MSLLSTTLQRASDSLTVRARLGLIVLVALAGIVAAMDLSARNTRLVQQLATVRTELAGREAALEQRDWNTVLEAARAEVDAAESRFWRGATTGLASAQILGAVENAARVSRLATPRVSVLRSEPLSGGAVLFEVEMTARSNGGGFATFLEAVTQAEGDLRPAEVVWGGRNRPVTIRLIAPAIIEGGAS
ncbi:hypothetical protein [Maricaulis maris]|uniref:hypothetical protein n=1 Tax=Maricaulis maris TaxID=74318 RepID=UPI0029271537|nr:hypothetical protein MACH15_24560 [Maricaulis maris]